MTSSVFYLMESIGAFFTQLGLHGLSLGTGLSSGVGSTSKRASNIHDRGVIIACWLERLCEGKLKGSIRRLVPTTLSGLS